MDKKFRPFLLLTLFTCSIFFFTFTPSSFGSNGLILFSTQETAQTHCPNDEVVWLNLPTGIWHTKWQRWYGRTKNGAYVCKQEAAAAGNMASRNG